MNDIYKIKYYKEPGITTGSLQLSLTQIFKNTQIQIESFTTQQLLNDPELFKDKTIGIILPGITGENSPYAVNLGEQGIKILKSAVENDGLSILGKCAGAYHLAEQILYNTPWGTQKSRNPGLDFFPITAYGPEPGLARVPTPGLPDDCVAAPVTFIDTNGKKHEAKICYSNGPYFLPSDIDEDTDIIAEFNLKTGNLIASASRPCGIGLAIFTGILPEISGQHCPPYTDISKKLSPYEPERIILLKTMVNKMIDHHNTTKGREIPRLTL